MYISITPSKLNCFPKNVNLMAILTIMTWSYVRIAPIIYQNGNFGEYFKTKSDQSIFQNAANCTIFSKFSRKSLPPNTFAMHSMQCRDIHVYTSGKIICTPLLNLVMYAHLLLFGKKYDKKGPLQFIKITLHWLHQLFCKNTTFTVFVRFLKKTLHFTRSLKKSNFTCYKCKAAKLATLVHFV